MVQQGIAVVSSTDRELIITRAFNAPRELVFRAWTDPEHVAQWWGPKGFTNPVCEVDARPGGKLEIHMQAPDGQIHPMEGSFDEIVEPERLVLTSGAIEDEHGEPKLLVRTTVTFEEVDGTTRLTMHAVVLRALDEAQGAVAGMEQGWLESFERLDAFTARQW